MNQDSTEAPVEDRPAPGDSIARRLFRRGATRASVGPRAEFYHRLGVADPYNVDGSDDAEQDGGFTFLSAAGYYRDLRRSRLGLLGRITAGARTSERIGARLRAVGPAAATIRPSSLARMGLMEDDFTVLADPALVEEEEEESTGYRIVPRAPRGKPTPQRTRERVVFRPVEQAMARDGGVGDDELSKVFERVLAGFRGRERRELRSILEEVASQPAARRIEVARKAMRRLGGVARAVVQAEAGDVMEQGERPTQVAAGRAQRGEKAKGLRRVLGASPAVLVLEQPSEESSEIEEVAAPRVVRRVSPPAPSRRPAARQGSAREAARTSQASGRAGPANAAAPVAASAAPAASRRPMERMAARAQQAAALPEHVRGPLVADAPARRSAAAVASRRVADVVFDRAEAGEVQSGARAPLSRAATGYVAKRSRSARGARGRLAQEAVFVTARAVDGEEASEAFDEQGVPRSRLQARRPRSSAPAPRRAAPSQRALERSVAVVESGAGVSRQTEGSPVPGRVQRLAAAPATPSVASSPAAPTSVAAVARRSSVWSSPVGHVRLDQARQREASSELAGMPARRRRRVATPSLVWAEPAAVESDDESVMADSPRPTVRAVQRSVVPAAVAKRSSRSVRPVRPTSYLAAAEADIDIALSQHTEAASRRTARASVEPSSRVAERGGDASPELGALTRERSASVGSIARAAARSEAPSTSLGGEPPLVGQPIGRRARASESPMVRAARRNAALVAPEGRRQRSVLPASATAYLLAELEPVDEAGPGLAEMVSSRRSTPAGVSAASSRAARPVGPTAPRTAAERAEAPARRRPERSERVERVESAVVRAARRRVAPTAVASARKVALAVAPTAYLSASSTEVDQASPVAVAAVSRVAPRPTERIADRAQPVIGSDERGRALLSGSPVAYARREVLAEAPAQPLASPGGRLEVPAAVAGERLADELVERGSLAPRAAARRPTAPELLLATSEETPAVDEAADEPRARRVATRAPDQESSRAGQLTPAQRVARRAEQGDPLQLATTAAAARAPSARRVRPSAVATAVLPGMASSVNDLSTPAEPASTSRRPRATARVLARRSAPTQSARHAAPARAIERVPASLPSRRPAEASPAGRASSPGRVRRALSLSAAPAVAALLRSQRPATQQLLASPVGRFDWSAVVDAVVGERQRLTGPAVSASARPLAADALEFVQPTAESHDDAEATTPLSLRSVARRTREAVHALGRSERSVLTFDASRRAFGEPAGREHTVEARVEQGADGRVRRVRATRLSTGEQVLLDSSELPSALDESIGSARSTRSHRTTRPSQASWVEERVTVGRARGDAGASVARETPGARIVERAAAPDGRIRRQRPMPSSPVWAAGQVDDAVAGAPFGDVAGGARPVRRRRSAAVALGPVTLASASLPAVVSDDAELGTVAGRRSPVVPQMARQLARVDDDTAAAAQQGATGRRRSLRGSMAALQQGPERSARAATARARRVSRGRQAAGRGQGDDASRVVGTSPELELARPWAPEELDGRSQETDARAPGWVKRANEGSSVPERSQLPGFLLRPRLRTSGGLLTALARAGDAEEIVRVILERSNELGEASALPVAAQRLMHRVAGEAHQVAAAARGDRPMRGGAVAPQMVDTVKSQILQPVTVAPSGPHSTATTRQGVGASKVMKLANKLMKLIHLAETDGRGDAHKHVRMSEDTAESRAEGGAGGTSGDQFDEKTMNIKALRQDVLDAVLKALEDMRWRREDPDGPSIWC